MVVSIYTVQSGKLEASGLHSAFRYVSFGSDSISQIIFVKMFSGSSDLKSQKSWLFTKLLVLLPGHIG